MNQVCSAYTLLLIINRFIVRDLKIVSDCWMAYNSLSDLGYNHIDVIHSHEFRDELTKAQTDIVEGTWKWTKTCVIDAGGCLGAHLQLMLDCYSFKVIWNENKVDNALRTICKAVSQNYHRYTFSDFE